MAFEGPGPYYCRGQAGVGAPNFRYGQVVSARSVASSVAFAAGAAAAHRIVKPGVAGSTAAPASETTPQDFGWNFLAADMDAAAPTSLPATRRVPAGVWTFTCVLEPSLADVGAVTRVHLRLHGRNPAGALQNLAEGDSTPVVCVPAVEQTHTIALTLPEISVSAGWSIQAEYHIVGRGAAVGTQTIIFVIGTPTVQPTAASFTMPGEGLRYRFARPTDGDAAPAADAVERAAKWPRATADTAAATDTVTRSIAVTRALADSAPAVDSVSRIGRWPRAVDDSAPATDALTRVARWPRAVADLAPATDVVTRSIAVTRALTDSAPATDAVERIARWPRALTEQIGPAEAPPASPLPVVIYRGKVLVSIGGGLYT